MSFEGVNIRKGQGGLNRSNANTDAVMALVVHSPEAENVNFEKAIATIQPSDLDSVAINESYDANNLILLHHHVEEFYRLAPEGTLFVVVTAKATAAEFFASEEAKGIFREHSEIKNIGFVYNSNIAGLELAAEANACQTFISELGEDHLLVNGIFLEGRNIGVGGANLRELSCPNISVVIAQDSNVAAIDNAYRNYAAVGAALGMRAVRKPNENLGSVDVLQKPDGSLGAISYPLTNAVAEKWLQASLSDGTPVAALSGRQRKQLTEHGYIYAGAFQGLAGYYFNGEPTAIAVASDYSSGENNGVWNKAARLVRIALLPKVRGWFQRNADTGELAATDTTNLQNLAERALTGMVAEEEISGFEVRVPDGQSPNDQNPLKVYITVRLGAIIHEFTVDLSLN